MLSWQPPMLAGLAPEQIGPEQAAHFAQTLLQMLMQLWHCHCPCFCFHLCCSPLALHSESSKGTSQAASWHQCS